MATQGRRRALGQHFLRDTQVCHQIADTAIELCSKDPCKALLEIGPGQGAITLPILERLSQAPSLESFTLVERDAKLAQKWKENREAQALGHFFVECGDFLEVPRERWVRGQPLGVVSNLPYSAGTAILVRLAEETQVIPWMVLMFQAEVAKRLMAGPSEEGRGSLSVWIQNHWDVRSLMKVPPRAFSPPPEVQSEVVVLTRRETPRIATSADAEASQTWQAILKAAFAHRRKMLRSTFPWPQALTASGVDSTLRAEALNWPQWQSLFEAVRKHRA